MKETHGIVLGLTPQPVKSSYSCGYNNSCVMVASDRPGAVQVSDSKVDDSPELVISPEAWNQMIRDVKNGR